jgi:hypothetical protein
MGSDSALPLQHDTAESATNELVFLVCVGAAVVAFFTVGSWCAWRTFISPCKNDAAAMTVVDKRKKDKRSD